MYCTRKLCINMRKVRFEELFFVHTFRTLNSLYLFGHNDGLCWFVTCLMAVVPFHEFMFVNKTFTWFVTLPACSQWVHKMHGFNIFTPEFHVYVGNCACYLLSKVFLESWHGSLKALILQLVQRIFLWNQPRCFLVISTRCKWFM